MNNPCDPRASGSRRGRAPAIVAPAAARRLALICAFALFTLAAPAASAARAPAASAARSARGHRPAARPALSETYVKEQGRLHSAGGTGGAAIAEQGSATGTFDAGIQINLVVRISKVTGSFVAHLKGGTISGYASAVPHVSGRWVSFKGSLKIDKGSGRYAGASGTASLYGSLDREGLKLNVQVVGRLRL